MKTKLLITLLIIPFFIGAIEMRPLNPDALASAEVKAWQAYYQKDRIALIKAISALISQQYPIKDPQAWSEIIPPLGIAMYRFGNMPPGASQSDYETQVLPYLTDTYKALGLHLKADWDPEEVARHDMEWWILRRKPETHNPEIVGSKIAQLYQKIFGKQNSEHFYRAGYLRAVAARYRDICQLKWGKIEKQDWAAMEEILILSYKELNLGLTDHPSCH